MKTDKYPVIIGETAMVFEFVSIRIKGRIDKLIIYSETDLPNFYNVGFGKKNEITGKIDDEVITNNCDSNKVLVTVASTLYTFTDKFSDAKIFAIGSTKSRTRLYRIGISNNLSTIEHDFDVFGMDEKEEWHKFTKQTAFEAFLIKRKKLILLYKTERQL